MALVIGRYVGSFMLFVLFAGPVYGQQNDLLREKLQQIQQQMNSATTQFEKGVDGELIRSQQQIVDDLSALVRQFSSGEQSGGPVPQVEQNTQSSQSGTMQGEGQATANTQGETDIQLTELQQRQLVLRVWGLMRGEQRDDSTQGIAPRFLPRFEKRIREYYRRMSR